MFFAQGCLVLFVVFWCAPRICVLLFFTKRRKTRAACPASFACPISYLTSSYAMSRLVLQQYICVVPFCTTLVGMCLCSNGWLVSFTVEKLRGKNVWRCISFVHTPLFLCFSPPAALSTGGGSSLHPSHQCWRGGAGLSDAGLPLRPHHAGVDYRTLRSRCPQ